MTGTVILILRLLMALALYAFLAAAIYTIWRDLRAQAEAVSVRQIPALLLRHQANPPEQPREFKSPEVVIGRDPSCELIIANETVSAHHARLSYHHNQWWLEDMQSTNGTFLNDERVYTPIVVISGDELRCGEEFFEITIQPR
ncbi:MAG TPA: FHA domain-containing protein [Anaerolineaceae bacterium]|nr:FHA domain-containing protein [Anaerolineaceae bacterium]